MTLTRDVRPDAHASKKDQVSRTATPADGCLYVGTIVRSQR